MYMFIHTYTRIYIYIYQKLWHNHKLQPRKNMKNNNGQLKKKINRIFTRINFSLGYYTSLRHSFATINYYL